MKVNIGDIAMTPRFLNVRIAAIFESVELADSCGFTEGTDFRNEEYHIRGKSIGENRMLFAAVKRT